ncbi:class I SAM-dependent methyltransferase [candidate division WOR-3 bacterium]|nr:class I SAM-dependent methyltransferase [candidate division WOR-3 bacterium]
MLLKKRSLYKSIGTTTFIRLIEYKSILKSIPLYKNLMICDVACGRGALVFKLLKKRLRVYGIDRSEETISIATRITREEHLPDSFIVGDALNLPYRSNCFLVVVSNSSLEHFSDDIKALREMKRVLKPKGLLILTVDSLSLTRISKKFKEMHKKVFFINNYYTHISLIEKLHTVGLEVIFYEYYLTSFISYFLYRLGVYFRKSGWLSLAILPIAYSLCSIFDKLFGIKNAGIGLVAKCQKL